MTRRTPTTFGRLRQVARFATWTLLGLGAGLVFAPTALAVAGFHTYIVRSGSMEPSINTGDIIVDRTISPLDARVGDTITFRDPNDKARLITHRVRNITVHKRSVHFTTIGVANNAPEHWRVPTTGHIGRTERRIPGLGWLLAPTTSPEGRVALLVIPALALGTLAIIRIWRPQVATATKRATT